MVLPKKKTVSRKRVLDLETSNDGSPPPSSWQAKYKELLPADSPKPKNGAPLGGLVGDYDSSSESDSESSRDAKVVKIAEKSVAESEVTTSSLKAKDNKNGGQHQIPGSAWTECYDKTTGFPYYWNQLTNQVTWQPPAEYQTAHLMRKQSTSTAIPSLPIASIVPNKDTEQSVAKKYSWDSDRNSEDGRIEKNAPAEKSDGQSSLGKKNIVSKNLDESRLSATNEDGHDVYETSSLMTPLVPDTGPPGDEPAASSTTRNIDKKCDQLKNTGKTRNNLSADLELADKILAEIDKLVPPDFVKTLTRRPSSETKPSTSFALIASYGDDSDQEETTESQQKPTPCLFPSATTEPVTVVTQTLFPSAVTESPVVEVKPQEIPRRELIVSNSPPAVLDPNLPDTSSSFKRKRRIEFAPAPRSDVIVPKIDVAVLSKPSDLLLDYPPVTEPNTRYNMEPGTGERRGFGFSHLEPNNMSEKKKSAIQFVKAETFSFQSAVDQKTKENTPNSKDLTDGAALLKEKLAFLGEGKEEVSAVQQMAIQLETLVSAWQSGALTPVYLSQWLGSRAVELSKNEQAAAPPGWICEWEREAKRYRYRNTTTGSVVWDYPEDGLTNESHQLDSVQDEVEMELSNTPPRSLSPSRQDLGSDLIPPPPPDISRNMTPPPPPAPVIVKNSRTKKSVEEVSSSEDVRNIPPPPPPAENYPTRPPEPDQPPPPGVDASGKIRQNQPPLPIHPPLPDSPSAGNHTSKIRCLTSELDSFYMDLAKLGGTDSVTTTDNDGNAQPQSKPPLPPSPTYSPPPTNSNRDNSSRKRKKGKNAAGLTLKKKGVSSLVAKWQQVQEEARKHYSTDEDNDDVSTTH